MFKLFLTISAFLMLSVPTVFSQNKTTKPTPGKYALTKNERSLAEAINQYRTQKGQGELQLSPSLSFVAHTHLEDIRLHSKDEHGCNLNSWSDKGTWTPCCFDGRQKNMDLMTSKPGEIIGFRGKGYEIVVAAKKGASTKDLTKLWLSTKATQDFILNKGQWSNRNWQCVGVSIYKGFASLWASDMPDRMSNAAFENEMARISGRDTGDTNPAEKSTTEQPVQTKTIKRPGTIIEAEQPVSEDKGTSFYLVHSSYSSIRDATNAFVSLKKEGFKNLVMIDARGKYRLALGIYTTEAAAKAAMRKNYPRFDHLMIYNF